MSARAASLRLTLWAQRAADRLPSAVRPIARRLHGWVGAQSSSSSGITTDWSRPLLARGAAAITASAAAEPVSHGSVPEQRWVATRGPRCLLVTQDLDAGGMGAVVSFLALGLPHHGIDTRVLHLAGPHQPGMQPNGEGRIAQHLRQAGVPVTSVTSAADGRRWLRQHRPDVVNAHIAPDWVLDAATELQIPFVETLHLGTTLRNWSREAERAPRIAAIISVSELQRAQYLQGNPVYPEDRVVTIPNAVDRDRVPVVDRAAAREGLGLREEFLFVSLARFSLEKNSYGLVSAFLEVARLHPAAHLLVAGRVDDPAYAHQVRLLCDRSPDGDRVHLRDHHSNPWALLAAADAFALDSFFEGWALASMEALCMGTPLVLSEVGGAREQVGETGEGGYLVPNALSDSRQPTWEAIRAVRFAEQANRAQLVAALGRAIDERPRWRERRAELAAASKDRFSAERCLRAHATVLAGACRTMEGAQQ